MPNCMQIYIYMQISASTDFFEGLSSNLTPIFINIRSHLHTLCWKHSLCSQVEDTQSIVCEGKMRSQATSPLSPTRLHPIPPGPRPSARQLRQLWRVAETKGRKDAERSWQHQHGEDENTTGYYRPNGSTRLGNGLLLRFDWVLQRTLNIVKWWMDCQFCKLTRKNRKICKNIYYEILRVCWHVINIHLCPVRDINKHAINLSSETCGSTTCDRFPRISCSNIKRVSSLTPGTPKQNAAPPIYAILMNVVQDVHCTAIALSQIF